MYSEPDFDGDDYNNPPEMAGTTLMELAERARRLEEEGRMPSPEQLAEAWAQAIEEVLGPGVDW
jgi:hypothetical protein